MSKLHQLKELGQSIWLDFIRRSYLLEGKLKALVDDGLGGVTSNPTIFEKAIAGSSDYDEALQKLVQANKSVNEIYEALAIEDISMAAQQLRPVYDKTDGADGFVSLEVDPTLAHNTEKTIEEAIRLYETVNQPNVMIKVPATPAGIPAIETLIAAGVNINVTLIFSVENYRDVAYAYINGLKKLAKTGPTVKGGHPVNRIGSVASFFVSRVDSAVDNQLKEIGNTTLLGKIAIANAKVAYKLFQEIFNEQNAEWKQLQQLGARVQRPLWASTSTKNPDYPDTMYVDNLIGPYTVNTVPPNTLDAFLDHGIVAETITKNVEEAEAQLKELTRLGIDLDKITDKLQEDGVESFAKSFESLMGSIAEKRQKLLGEQQNFSVRADKFKNDIDSETEQQKKNEIVNRLWQRDHTIWKDDPTEITNRLGWLDSPEKMMDAVPEITEFVDQLLAEGYTNATLLGMGGSSLAPELFAKTFDIRDGYLNLTVLDSTHPETVESVWKNSNPQKTIYIVSTKSGGTVETLSFTKYMYNKCLEEMGEDEAGKHFVAITDPGSGLVQLAKKLNFRKIFLNDPNIGGRYSALSFFGLVPAALCGVDIHKLLERAERAVEISKQPLESGNNEAVTLGIVMGKLATLGVDKLTLVTSPDVAAFGAWLEQLIAESTGKEGKGILPVDGEPLSSLETYRKDRLFVHITTGSDSQNTETLQQFAEAGFPVITIRLNDLYDLGKEFFRWEVATAISGAVLRINPFDQPNVESAKISAREMLAAYQKDGKLPEESADLQTEWLAVFGTKANSPANVLETFLAGAHSDAVPMPYIAIQAFVRQTESTDRLLQSLRVKLLQRYRCATTLGYGPRFLHSTGQLHKGDAGNGYFIQFTQEIKKDVPIPDQAGMDFSSVTFGTLLLAQALGDRKALLDANRKVLRIHVKDIEKALTELEKAL
jgi:transaldolase/glucose-6-phosphate isomerase